MVREKPYSKLRGWLSFPEKLCLKSRGYMGLRLIRDSKMEGGCGMKDKEDGVKGSQSPVARTRKCKAKTKEFRVPDLTPEDVQEALLDWLRKHPERWEGGNG